MLNYLIFEILNLTQMLAIKAFSVSYQMKSERNSFIDDAVLRFNKK